MLLTKEYLTKFYNLVKYDLKITRQRYSGDEPGCKTKGDIMSNQLPKVNPRTNRLAIGVEGKNIKLLIRSSRFVGMAFLL